jgi:hypothetical protein
VSPGRSAERSAGRPTGPLHFGLAATAAEREQIHRLNHATFVLEIRQHSAEETADGRRVDRFDAENDYVLARRGERVVGMIAVRGRRPFSLEQKMDGLDAHLDAGRTWCELRLLAILPEERGGLVLRGLLEELLITGTARGYDAAVLSAYAPRAALYARLGATAFGELVGTAEIPFQPMKVTREAFAAALAKLRKRGGGRP